MQNETKVNNVGLIPQDLSLQMGGIDWDKPREGSLGGRRCGGYCSWECHYNRVKVGAIIVSS